MNRENLLRVADAIEKHEVEWLGFNMLDYVIDGNDDADRTGRGCGTTACVAGWASVVAQDIRTAADLIRLDGERVDCSDVAQEYLELTDNECMTLFAGRPTGVPFSQVAPAQAVATLRYAAKHDVVDWNAACAGLHESPSGSE